MSKRTAQIKDCLETLYARYNRREFIGSDPLQFVYEYSNHADMEVVALLAAELAYGRVQQIQKSLADLLGRMGESPYAFVGDFGKAERKILTGFKHRFTTGQHISDLLWLLRGVFEESGSIEKHFLLGYNKNDENILPALSKFCDSLYAMHNGQVSRGLRYLLTNPTGGSACKRLNLFLRWMVRDDEVDLGLWRTVDKAKLIAPVDVHMARLCRILGLHPVRSNPGKSGRPPLLQTSNGADDRKTVSLSTALKITKSFAEIEPADPVKYDFALTRIGIVEDCDGNYRPGCQNCEMFRFCCK